MDSRLRFLLRVGLIVSCIIAAGTVFRFPISATPSVPPGEDWSVSIRKYLSDDGELLFQYENARKDHASLLSLINMCLLRDAQSDDSGAAPGSRMQRAKIWIAEVLAAVVHKPDMIVGFQTANAVVPPELILQNRLQRAAVVYSDRLQRDRIVYHSSLNRSKQRTELFQWLIVGLGALATVTIGIKALWTGQQHPRLSVIIGIVALAASATGTALGTMSSFYGNQEEVLRNHRTLSQLTQLHWRIVQDALTDPKICIPEEKIEPTDLKETAAQILSWKQRHEEILNDATPNFSRPGDVHRSGSNTADQQGKPSPSKPVPGVNPTGNPSPG